jgi:hypothetical protein
MSDVTDALFDAVQDAAAALANLAEALARSRNGGAGDSAETVAKRKGRPTKNLKGALEETTTPAAPAPAWPIPAEPVSIGSSPYFQQPSNLTPEILPGIATPQPPLPVAPQPVAPQPVPVFQQVHITELTETLQAFANRYGPSAPGQVFQQFGASHLGEILVQPFERQQAFLATLKHALSQTGA